MTKQKNNNLPPIITTFVFVIFLCHVTGLTFPKAVSILSQVSITVQNKSTGENGNKNKKNNESKKTDKNANSNGSDESDQSGSNESGNSDNDSGDNNNDNDDKESRSDERDTEKTEKKKGQKKQSEPDRSNSQDNSIESNPDFKVVTTNNEVNNGENCGTELEEYDSDCKIQSDGSDID